MPEKRGGKHPQLNLLIEVEESQPPRSLADLQADVDALKGKLSILDAYGAIEVKGIAEPLVTPMDRVFLLLSRLAQVLPYVLDGEPETVLWTESEHSMLLQPTGKDMALSLIAGDMYEPDEVLIAEQIFSRDDFAEAVLTMAKGLSQLSKAVDGQRFEDDGGARGFTDFIKMAEDALKTYRLEKQRGLR